MCAVWLILIAVQHRLHIGNVVNRHTENSFPSHMQSTAVATTVVLKFRPFMFVEKQCDVAVSTVCLFVCLSVFKQSTLPADIISVQMEGELIFCFV